MQKYLNPLPPEPGSAAGSHPYIPPRSHPCWEGGHGHGNGNHGGGNNSEHRPAAGGAVNVVYFCEEDNTVWANGVIWAAGLVDGKGNVNSSELTNVPEGYKLKEVGDFYYDGGSELRIQIVPWYR